MRIAKVVPYSSVVGASVSVEDARGAVALIIISVPQPSIPYKETALPLAEEIARLLNECPTKAKPI